MEDLVYYVEKLFDFITEKLCALVSVLVVSAFVAAFCIALFRAATGVLNIAVDLMIIIFVVCTIHAAMEGDK